MAKYDQTKFNIFLLTVGGNSGIFSSVGSDVGLIEGDWLGVDVGFAWVT